MSQSIVVYVATTGYCAGCGVNHSFIHLLGCRLPTEVHCELLQVWWLRRSVSVHCAQVWVSRYVLIPYMGMESEVQCMLTLVSSLSLDPFELPHCPCLILLFIVLVIHVDHLLLLMHWREVRRYINTRKYVHVVYYINPRTSKYLTYVTYITS